MRLHAEVWAWRHGWAWPLCVALVGAAAFAQWQFVVPARAELAQARQALLEARIAAARRGAKPVAASTSNGTRLERLEEALRGAGTPDGDLSTILDAATRHSIELPRAEYQSTFEPVGGVLRTQIALPVKAPYPVLRAFVEDVLRSLPNASVDQLSFKRDSVMQSQVEATLKVSLWALPRHKAVRGTGADESVPGRKP